MKLIFFFVLFLIYLTYTASSVWASDSKCMEMNVILKNPNGSRISKDLIQFIEEGRKKPIVVGDLPIQERAIMFLGVTGAGKSTLANYLNSITLVSKKIDGKWVLEPKTSNETLGGSFAIGHTIVSKVKNTIIIHKIS
jgi:hypothetical protein